jgi:uncharacterized protein DUF4440
LKRILFVAVLAVLTCATARAQTATPSASPPSAPPPSAPDAAELTRLLTEFLAGASRNDAAVHDRFWSDDLVYTGSSGRRIGKADILADVRKSGPAKPGEPATTYTAEDIRIRQYGDTAVVAFRLVGTTVTTGTTTVARYLNTGTLVKRGGQWRAVAWQATRMARPADQVRADVVATLGKLQLAIIGEDAAGVETLADEGFVWTSAGGRTPRAALLDLIRAGRLKDAKLDNSDVSVVLYGDTVVVRGTATLARGDTPPLTSSYTLTLVDRGAGLTAVALQTSR